MIKYFENSKSVTKKILIIIKYYSKDWKKEIYSNPLECIFSNGYIIHKSTLVSVQNGLSYYRIKCLVVNSIFVSGHQQLRVHEEISGFFFKQ